MILARFEREGVRYSVQLAKRLWQTQEPLSDASYETLFVLSGDDGSNRDVILAVSGLARDSLQLDPARADALYLASFPNLFERHGTPTDQCVPTLLEAGSGLSGKAFRLVFRESECRSLLNLPG